jgi:hypothetical protein
LGGRIEIDYECSAEDNKHLKKWSPWKGLKTCAFEELESLEWIEDNMNLKNWSPYGRD